MNFFVLSDYQENISSSNIPYIRTWCEAWAVDRMNGPCERCPLCGRPVSMRKWESPRRIRLSSGRCPDHLVHWLNEPLIVSEAFFHAYAKSDLTGIRAFHEIQVVPNGRKKENVQGSVTYFLADVSFTDHVTLDTKATVMHGQKRDWSCATCNPFGMTCDRIERIALNTTQWDGSDVFRLYTGGTICTSRFCDFVQKNKFTNFCFVPIEEYSWHSETQMG